MSNIDKNPAHIQTVDFARHGKLKVKPNPGFVHAKDRNLVAVSVSELGISSGNFPLVFVQEPSDKRYVLMAMLGLKSGENIFYGPDFWESTYIPMAVQRHPFIVGIDDRVQDTLELATCVEINSAYLNDKEGLPLFTDDGQETDTLRSAHQMLRRMFETGKYTEQFIATLQQLDLIMPFEISLKQQRGELAKLTGLFTIDENKLKALSAEQLKDLQTREFLAPCHLMLVSLYQLSQLIRMRNRKGGEQIVDFRLDFPKEQAAAANA